MARSGTSRQVAWASRPRSQDTRQGSRGERAVRAAFIGYLVALVGVPLCALVHFSVRGGLTQCEAHLASPVTRDALSLTLWTSLLVGGLNAIFGTAIAWVLVRYRLPGRTVLSAAIDLPLAIPTLVAGVMLVVLYGPASPLGRVLIDFGVPVAFAKPGIVLALLFVTLPLVVRAVEPVLAEVDPAEEEAAILLGASPWRVFRAVFLPAIVPAALSGAIRAMGRASGEFGAVVVIAGNVPFETLTAPVAIFGDIESGAPVAAAAASTVLIAFALLLHGGASLLERRTGARHAQH